MKEKMLIVIIALLFSTVSCKNRNTSTSQLSTIKELKNNNTMNSFISIFEIPATDISRAINFYKEILELEIEKLEFPGMEMGLLPLENQMVVGVIMKGEGYNPSSDGVTIYLNGGNDLQPILDKVKSNGGKILIPKTPHADEVGFFAIFQTPTRVVGYSSSSGSLIKKKALKRAGVA